MSNDSELTRAGALELRDRIARGDVSAVEVARAHLDRIERFEPSIHAFLHRDPEATLAQARAIDQARAAGEPLGRLAGVPIALKDVLCTRGVPTTCGSRMLANYRPPFDATVVRKLNEAGAVIVGKVNMDEFAMGSSTENSHFGPTHNPWDLERTPGGSSGGSAAAVAAGFAPLALGTDTGGSIRQPAAFCGIVGLKPSYGRVSRFGLVAFASSLDQIGPMSRSVADAALLLNVIAGADPRDATCVDRPVPDYLAGLNDPIGPDRPLKVGYVPEFLTDGLDDRIKTAVDQALQTYRELGAEIREVHLPHTRIGIAAYYIVAPCEASSNLARYDGTIFGHRAADWSPASPGEEELSPTVRMMMASRAEGFGAEVKRRIMLGTFALSAGYADQYYNKALKVRRLIRQDFDQAFEQVDVIVGPTTPTPAFRLGEKTDDPLAMYLSDVYTITANLAGIPGLSLPFGLTTERLPIGVQLLAKPFDEPTLLRAAALLEAAVGSPGVAPLQPS
ncbi:aspartyl/glutamyl-tRNA(Asn/Gln) amidotransferase subunit A [Isosphaera pallida ATCC 43644]|uniref:Glutamyl-tRNA(Gln) amidotransferase subunit A n=1 Tax=Isosphaera pallida (strain ATCC 43644 / DSM 9630 / IS1B) TaxID=575540 RepID=E8R260_ISOPI|nr:Asp-tRNA(Asn)/Glu-tRNA(Gln) amidotransferase subunit GatA [Isosphaera pallida]ADV63490.1 aspartyl/glutamyl-tRNA(Asn/Gln) amidotransferase subunit A [Isosphaera pallida ATCC 43644]